MITCPVRGSGGDIRRRHVLSQRNSHRRGAGKHPGMDANKQYIVLEPQVDFQHLEYVIVLRYKPEAIAVEGRENGRTSVEFVPIESARPSPVIPEIAASLMDETTTAVVSTEETPAPTPVPTDTPAPSPTPTVTLLPTPLLRRWNTRWSICPANRRPRHLQRRNLPPRRTIRRIRRE